MKRNIDSFLLEMRCLFMNNNVNFQKSLLNELELIKKQSKKPTLLLHVCCCPCFLIPFGILKDYFEISIFYYNPNIYPESEYLRRKNELLTYLKQNKIDDINFIECKYNFDEFLKKIEPFKNEKEGHNRCRICFKERLTYAYQYACSNNFDYISTVMTISRYKNSKDINEIGLNLQKEFDNKAKWLIADFKKNNGYEKELLLIKKLGLYFQEYCGCKYSYQAYLEKKNKHL